MAEFLFYLSIVLIIYTYFGYPMVLFFLSLLINKEVKRGGITPEVTVIIPVHNEESIIGTKIRNCLDFDYPRNKLKIVVASDGSTDRTEEIVREFKSDQIRFIPLPYRGGKVAAQNYAVQMCDSEIFVFTDAAISTSPDCVRLIVENFNDETIGVVSCTDAIVAEEREPRGEKSYIRYDMMVRKYTSRISSIIGVTGGFYAVRREIAKGGWNPAFPPDFYVAIRSIKRRLRVIEDSRVKAYYKTAAKEWDELPRKVRTINRGMHALFAISNRTLMNPFKYGIVSLELISHKLFRWMTPFFFVVLLVSTIALFETSILARYLLIPQIGLYLLAAVAFFSSKKIGEMAPFKLANYFVIANMAILQAWGEFLMSKRYVMWQPTKR